MGRSCVGADSDGQSSAPIWLVAAVTMLACPGPRVHRAEREVDGVEDRLLLHLREEGAIPVEPPAEPRGVAREVRGGRRPARLGREHVIRGDVVLRRQPELLQVVGALRAACRLAGRLDGREQQRDQHRDDRDHHQQLDQRETATNRRCALTGSGQGASPSGTRFRYGRRLFPGRPPPRRDVTGFGEIPIDHLTSSHSAGSESKCRSPPALTITPMARSARGLARKVFLATNHPPLRSMISVAAPN